MATGDHNHNAAPLAASITDSVMTLTAGVDVYSVATMNSVHTITPATAGRRITIYRTAADNVSIFYDAGGNIIIPDGTSTTYYVPRNGCVNLTCDGTSWRLDDYTPDMTNNAILRGDAVAGQVLVQGSLVTIDDSGSVNIPSGQVYKINGTALAYGNVGAAAAGHNHTGTYAPTTHAHAGEDVTSGTLDGDRLPALSETKKGGVPATGTPSGKYLKDDGTWATPAGGAGDMTKATYDANDNGAVDDAEDADTLDGSHAAAFAASAHNHTGTYVPFSGGTLTGAAPLEFEGATADAFETLLQIIDPTADRQIRIPNATGDIPLCERYSGITNVNQRTITTAASTLPTTSNNYLVTAMVSGTATTVGLLHLEANLNDDAAGGSAPHTFTAIGNVSYNGSGKFGSDCLLLDGTNAYVYSSSHTDWDWNANDWCVEGWFKSTQDRDEELMAKWTSPFFSWRVYRASSGLVSAQVSEDGSTPISLSSSGGYSADGNFHHVALTCDYNAGSSASAYRLYVDGSKAAETLVGGSSGVFNGTAAVMIGWRPSANYFDGRIDEVRLTKGDAVYTGAGFSVPTSAFTSAVRKYDLPGVAATAATGYVPAYSGTVEQGDLLYYSATSWTLLPHGTDGQVLKTAGHAANPSWTSTVPTHTHVRTQTVTFVFDGDGAAVATGIGKPYRVPVACTIKAWTLLADQTGSITVDVWRDTLANYLPTDADSITNGHEPALSSATSGEDTDITDWTDVTMDAGDVLLPNVDSCATCTWAVLILKLEVNE